MTGLTEDQIAQDFQEEEKKEKTNVMSNSHKRGFSFMPSQVSFEPGTDTRTSPEKSQKE